MKVRLLSKRPPGYGQKAQCAGWFKTTPPLSVCVVGNPLPNGYLVIILQDDAFGRPGQWALVRPEYVSFERPEAPQPDQPQAEVPRPRAPRQQLTLF